MEKTLIIAEDAPPVNNGAANRLKSWFSYFPKGSYCIIMPKIKRNYSPVNHSKIEKGYYLDCRYYYLPFPDWHTNISRYMGIMIRLIHFCILPYSIIKGMLIIKKERISNIFVTSGYGYYFVLAYYLTKITKIPYSVYMFDLWTNEQVVSRIHRVLIKVFEKRIFKYAKNVFVMSEPLGDYYGRKLGISPVVIPHSVDLKKYNCLDTKKAIDAFPEGNFKKIVFTGMINSAQRDAIRNMVNTLRLPGMESIKLILFTRADVDLLRQTGISGENVILRYARPEEIPIIQKKADILFLPLAFNSSMPNLIKTAMPGKLPEYLAAGRPILVHAPKGCFISEYAKDKGFAVVVDKPDRFLLKEGVLNIINDSLLREKIIANALETAKLHDAEIISFRLKQYLITQHI